MIRFEDTYFTYDGKPLISGFSLNIRQGEKVVLYGPSGSGKSTLIHALLGFVPIEKGRIYVNGKDVNSDNIAAIRNMTSWLPQDISIPYSTVREMISTPFGFKANRNLIPDDEQILASFDKLELPHDLLDKKAGEISGGQRQRILLSTTILLQKPILLVDEPTSALDANSVKMTIDYLKSLKETTMIAISHDSQFISSFDNKVLIPKI